MPSTEAMNNLQAGEFIISQASGAGHD